MWGMAERRFPDLCTDGPYAARRAVLAGAYRGKEKSFLTHAVFVDADGGEVTVVCKRVKLDNLVDCYGLKSQVEKPTCPTCLQKLAQ